MGEPDRLWNAKATGAREHELDRRRPIDKVPYPATFIRSGQWEEPPPQSQATAENWSEL